MIEELKYQYSTTAVSALRAKVLLPKSRQYKVEIGNYFIVEST